MKLLKAEAGVNDGKAGLLSAAGLFAKGGIFDKKSESFNIHELDPYLLFDAQSSMLGTLEAETLDLDPATPSTLDVITATRAGVATFTEPDGTIATAPSDTVRVDYTQGEQLTPTKFQNIGYTDFDQWTSENATITPNVVDSPFGNQDASKLVATSTSQRQGITIVTSVADSLVASVYAKKGEYDVLQITDARNGSYFVNFDLTNGAVGSFGGVIGEIQNIGNGWFRCISKFTSSLDIIRLRLSIAQSSTQARLVDFAGNGTDGIYIYGPQLEEGTTASSFVENTTGSPKFTGISATYSARVPMILVEPSATNLWGWSEGTLNDYQTNAVLYGGEYLSTDATSRNGLNSWLYFEPISDTEVGFRMPVSVNSGSTMILSFYVIMDDGSKPRVGTSSTGSDTDFAMLLQGSSSAGVQGGVEHIGGDLYRVWAYRVFTGTSNGQYIYRYEAQSGKGFKISGVMLEESSVPTSYIPTSGSTAQRAADDLEITGSDFDFYNASEGTVYTEFLYDHDQTSKYVYSITETNDNEIRSQILASMLRTRYTVNSSHLANLGNTEILKGSLNRAAFSYKTNNFRANLNGGSDTEDFSGTASINPIKLAIGSRTTANHLNGHIKRLIYWPTHSDSL